LLGTILSELNHNFDIKECETSLTEGRVELDIFQSQGDDILKVDLVSSTRQAARKMPEESFPQEVLHHDAQV
jgi:hypothetical protein